MSGTTDGADGGGGRIAVDVVASGALAAHLPANDDPAHRRGRARIELPSGSSVADLLAALHVTATRPLLLVLNGSVVTPAAREATRLTDGDAVSLAPPIRAG